MRPAKALSCHTDSDVPFVAFFQSWCRCIVLFPQLLLAQAVGLPFPQLLLAQAVGLLLAVALAGKEAFKSERKRARRSKLRLLACAAVSVACVVQLGRCLNSVRPAPYAVPALMPAPMFFLQMMADDPRARLSCHTLAPLLRRLGSQTLIPAKALAAHTLLCLSLLSFKVGAVA